MREAVVELWPELEWLENRDLRESVLQTWIRAFEHSPLVPQDLQTIPFTLLIAPGGKVLYRKQGRCDPITLRRAIVDHLGRTYR